MKKVLLYLILSFSILFLISCSYKTDTKIEKKSKISTKYFKCIENASSHERKVNLEVNFDPDWNEKQKKIHFFLHKRKHKLFSCTEMNKKIDPRF